MRTESEFVARLAAKFDEMILSFLTRLNGAPAVAALAVNAQVGSQDEPALADLFERVLHAEIQEAIQMLPQMPVDRREFDALPIVRAEEDSSDCVGLYRMQLRSWWILLRANANGKAGFFRPIIGGEIPLH
jgi:hypothetical protein